MSNFLCEHCGKPIIDSPRGYVTECKHYPLRKEEKMAVKKKAAKPAAKKAPAKKAVVKKGKKK